ncbi:MAG TPA: Gldg family protein, partial [Gemmatales bacterium]|nr:Gldg family protein [Gemmatales bacterium]
MSDLLNTRTQTRTAMIIVFVVAIAMLVGTSIVYSMAYNEVKSDLDKAPTPIAKPGEKPVELEKTVALGDAFSKATGKPFFWFTLLGAVSLGGLGLFLFFRQSTATETSLLLEEDRQWAKLSYFTMFSLVGFLTVVCLALPFTWIYSNEFLSRTGWSTGDNKHIPWLILLSYIVGLGSMFGSLLAIKSEERNSAGLRRWIYGYNAFLGSLLFLAILGIANAWFALYGPEPSDWTQTNIYSLSPAMKRLVKTIDKPTRAYVILNSGDGLADVLGTLNNCKSINSLLEVEHISYSRQNVNQINELIRKYDAKGETAGNPQGILLVQDPDSKQPNTTFIKAENLSEAGPDGQRAYAGETVLFTALRDFRQEKKKLTVYFSQDSGEFTIDEQAAQTMRNSTEPRSCVLLKQRLEKAGYVVKSLNLGDKPLGGKEAKVPDDALAVIVADPVRMTPEKAKVLDDYVSRPRKDGIEPGKLICFFDPHYGPDNKVLQTGLEGLLMKFGVQIGQDVIYAVDPNDPRHNPLQVQNLPRFTNMTDADIVMGMASLFESMPNPMQFRECRTVRSVPQQLGYVVMPLLLAYTQALVEGPDGTKPATWLETEKKANPVAYVNDLLKSNDLMKKEFQLAIFAVTVRERGPEPPQTNPMAPPPQSKPGTPR